MMSTTPPMITAAASAVRPVMTSPANAHPSSTATTGFTNA